MTMDARKQRVLQAIVALYGLEGEPVGSSVLANYFDMAVSSATLRNEMAALTKLGLLEQPHTSAGRVPSAKGYRYYLDNLLTDDQPLDRVTRARVDAVFASLDHEPEKLAQGAAKALAAISGCTAAVSTPCAEDLCIAHYEVVQVGRSAAAVLGAPLTHDFAVISLSDRLTPWETIEKRLDCAAAADLTIALYNPASHGRPDHLKRACDILLRRLPGGRLCGIVRNIGREGQSSRILTLAELREAEVDMFCTVLIGSAAVKTVAGQLVTPRGYRNV